MSNRSLLPHRSVLYLPANNARAIEKARTLKADVLIFDLEDAVHPQAKAQARMQLAAAFRDGGFGRSLRVLRINHPDTEHYSTDLQVLTLCAVDAVVVPKVGNGALLGRVTHDIRSLQLPRLPAVWAMVETTEALMHLDAIGHAGAEMTPPLECLVVGTNDIAKETSVSMSDGRAYLIPWLMSVVLAARRHGMIVLDGVWNDFRDLDGYEQEVRQSQKMGFDGKTLIHPGQIELANEVFAPSPAAVAEARVIVEAFSRPENIGQGVINLEGKMVELLHLEMARRILSIHEAISD